MQLELFHVDRPTQQTLMQYLIFNSAGVGAIQEFSAQEALIFQKES